jgi:hypothetical protein
MRALVALFAGAVLAIGLGAGAAGAAPKAFTGTLRLEIGSLAVPLVINGSGVTDVDPSDGSFTMPLGIFATASAVQLATTTTASIASSMCGGLTAMFPAFPICAVQLLSAGNQVGSFFPISGYGVMPLGGTANALLFGINPTTAAASIALPLAPIGKSLPTTAMGGGLGIAVQLVGGIQPWTVNTAVATTFYTEMGIPQGGAQFTRMGFDKRGPLYSGKIRYVVPFLVNTNITGLRSNAGFGTMQVDFLRACSDGLDNDGDVAVDYPSDSGCSSATDQTEETDCADGLDNDFDGLIDYGGAPGNDPGCQDTLPSSRENPQCNDGLDNDVDTLIDYPADADCSAAFDTLEGPAPPAGGCGMGFEILLLVGPLALLRGRRAAAKIA